MNRIAALAAILLTLLVLAGCGSRQAGSAQLHQAMAEVHGVDGQVGSLRLLNIAIESPGARGSKHIDGNSAALLLTIANDGKTEDVLTGAGTEVAERVVLRNGDAAPAPRLEVPVPPGKVAVLSEVTGPHLELSPLRDTLRPGSSVPITFEFRDAGSVTAKVPIASYTDVRPDKYLEPVGATTR